MSEMKMSDYFDLPVFAKSHEVGSRCSLFEGGGITVASSFYANQKAAYDAMAYAINNHDRLTEENAKLRKILTQLQIEGGLGVARHRQIDRLLNQLKDQNNDK